MMVRTKRINLSHLESGEKQRIWKRIKQVNPSLEALLKDSEFQSLKDHFEGEVVISSDQLEAVDHGQH